MHRTEGKTMAIQKALETLCYVNGCGLVAIESAQIHVKTGGSVARQLLDAPSLQHNFTFSLQRFLMDPPL